MGEGYFNNRGILGESKGMIAFDNVPFEMILKYKILGLSPRAIF